MAGNLYKTAFSNSGLTEDQTNGHWKHEQDNYLSQIGAMSLINRDPMARLGYQIRSGPDRTLEMGSNVDPGEDKAYGIYRFRPQSTEGRRYDGTLDVAVNQDPRRYGEVLAHELGHVGSRNSQTDRQILTNDGKDEEMRQRITDLANNGTGTPMGFDALMMLSQMGMKPEEVLAAVQKRRAELGLPPITPPSKPQASAPAANKKKRKVATSNGSPAAAKPEPGED